MTAATESEEYADLSTPKIALGGPGCPFALPRLAFGWSRESESRGLVRLSHYTGVKPVALVFGSYTCPPFRAQLGALEELYDRFGGRVAFFLVYIKEAHPEEGRVLKENRECGIVVREPTSLVERAAVAESCVLRLGIRMPVLLDGVDNGVARAYGGWPSRLYLIGRDGPSPTRAEWVPVPSSPRSWRARLKRSWGGEVWPRLLRTLAVNMFRARIKGRSRCTSKPFRSSSAT